MSLTTKMDEMEIRIAMSSFWAGLLEIALRFIFHVEFFGYLGTGLVLYALFHYAQLKASQRRRKKHR